MLILLYSERLAEPYLSESEEEGQTDEEEKNLKITFNPPLYIQRYEKVFDILSEERWVRAISRVVSLIYSDRYLPCLCLGC
jgi:hypothetical protein